MVKSTLLLLLGAAMFTSCIKDNDYHMSITTFVPISADSLLDTVYIYNPIEVNIEAELPNMCWHSLRFIKEDGDSTFSFAASATFENDGEVCGTEVRTFDTTYTIVPISTKKHIFYFFSNDTLLRADTVVVLPQSK